ncbi:hypothetical protein PG985_005456 [Apiospora marii]|uniref:uncharacterized protein n=1 Tax=Apiospora marii TaxID=335849 RepID=UPI0031320831
MLSKALFNHDHLVLVLRNPTSAYRKHMASNLAMADLTFVQYTGEPVRRQSARIPRADWEKKSRIVDLFLIYTLNEVIKKMAGIGFQARCPSGTHKSTG